MARIAIVGASGVVGEELLLILEELDFKVDELYLYASEKSAGKKLSFKAKEYEILELKEESFAKNLVDIAFFSAGSAVSAKYAPLAVKSKALVIDNTSYFRMKEEVPLIVPECNAKELFKNKGIIANPNCSTIQMVQVLKPLDDEFGLKRVDVSTYQAASGAGKEGMDELVAGMKSFFNFDLANFKPKVFKKTLAFNLIPQIDLFDDSGYTKEELKMINESQKILAKKIAISATCVRVPVLRSHSESLSLSFEKKLDLKKVYKVLKNAPNIKLIDDIKKEKYPCPLELSATNETFVGRVRLDLYDEKMLHLWCVADQIRVGAALNAVRIAIKYLEN